jgi:hypothetical protein
MLQCKIEWIQITIEINSKSDLWKEIISTQFYLALGHATRVTAHRWFKKRFSGLKIW